MKRIFGFLSLLLTAAITFANPIDFDKAFKESKKIEKQIKKTSFPKQTYHITDFGAKADNESVPCHEAINQAILQCSLTGGGTVIVPKGTFYTGPITLKSNVNFHLEEGAVLKFLTDQSLYFPGVITRRRTKARLCKPLKRPSPLKFAAGYLLLGRSSVQ